MIPKKIHYCWFGGNPLPDEAKKCIASWRKYCPDYEIVEWNEKNFDIDCCNYVKEAYEAKKWAFVSDYARFYILYKQGGIYFDTDVELIRGIDDIIQRGAFMGMEQADSRSCTGGGVVAPGLGMAAFPEIALYKEILEFYYNHHFFHTDGTVNQTTVCKYTTDILLKKGLKLENKLQYIAEVSIYPSEYFCPMNYETGELHITENTRSIHHYASTWASKEEIRNHRFKQKMIRKYGNRIGNLLERCYSLPNRVKKKIDERGFKGTISWIIEKKKNHNK